MAYHDLSGKVMIDEAAAMADVQKAGQAVVILREASNALKVVISESESFRGETAEALVEKASFSITGASKREKMIFSILFFAKALVPIFLIFLQGKVLKLIAQLEEMQSYTRKVVAHYQELDRQWRDIIAQMSKMKELQQDMEKIVGNYQKV